MASLKGAVLCLLTAALLAETLLATAAPGLLTGQPREEALPAAARADGAEGRSDVRARVARPRWKRRLDRIVAGRSIGVSVWSDGEVLYEHAAKRARVPASNQKLLLAMALLDTMPRTARIPTVAAARAPAAGVIRGDLWLLGRGDPTVTGGGAFARSLPLRATQLGRLARRIVDAGVTRITGSVRGGTRFFRRDWWATGWKSYFPRRYIALPTALTFDGNSARGVHVTNPEARAARSLTKKLRRAGVRVAGRPGAGRPPHGLVAVARIRSAPLEKLLRYTTRTSSNFFAEVLGKVLAVETASAPGTIAKGAVALRAYAARRGATVVSEDSSGLSYANRISARGLAHLLDDAEEAPWGPVLRRVLPTGGEGTLQHRLHGVRVRAKTGTLIRRSALSGYVRTRRRGEWVAFSIVSSRMDKSRAAAIEDRIVGLLQRRAR